MLERVPLLEKDLDDYDDVVEPRNARAHPRAGRAAPGRPGAPRQRHRVRRRRRRAARHPRPAAARASGSRPSGRSSTAATSSSRVTKAVHNALQGADVEWTAADAAHLPRAGARQRARSSRASGTTSSIHDPQPAAMLELPRATTASADASTKWIWRCHIDLTDANPDVWEFFRPFVEQYDASVWTMPEFVPDVAARWTASCTRRRASTRCR